MNNRNKWNEKSGPLNLLMWYGRELTRPAESTSHHAVLPLTSSTPKVGAWVTGKYSRKYSVTFHSGSLREHKTQKLRWKKKTGGQKPFEQHRDMRSWDLWCLHVKTSKHTCTTDWKHTGERWLRESLHTHTLMGRNTCGYMWERRVRKSRNSVAMSRTYYK